MQQASLWQNYDGQLKCVVKDPISGQIWGCNQNDEIFWREEGKPWNKIDGLLVQLCCVNKTVYGINKSQEIFYRNFGQQWVKMDGALVHIAVDTNGQIVGVNASQEVFFRANPSSPWQKLDGALVQVDFSNGWIIGVNQAGDIWKRQGPNGQWQKVDGAPMKHVSMDNDGTIVAINSQQQVNVRCPKSNQWKQYDGSLQQVHLRNKIMIGTNSQHGIFSRKVGPIWSELSGLLTCISQDPTNHEIWGVNASNEVFFKKEHETNWTKSDGLLIQLCVINNTVYGVNAGKEIWYKQNKGQWNKIDGLLKHIAVDKSGLIVGVNDQNEVFARQGPMGQWQKLDGALKQVDVANGIIVGVNAEDQIWKRSGINGQWQSVPGALKHVSIDYDGKLVGVNSNNEVYVMHPNKNWEQFGDKKLRYVQCKENKIVGCDDQNKIFHIHI